MTFTALPRRRDRRRHMTAPWQEVELELTATTTYGAPYTDVDVWADFRCGDDVLKRDRPSGTAETGGACASPRRTRRRLLEACGDRDRALGGVEADHPAGERRMASAVQNRPSSSVSSTSSPPARRDQADPVAAHGLGGEAGRRRRHLDAQLDLVPGQVGRPALPEPGDGGQRGHRGAVAAACASSELVLLVVADREAADAGRRVDDGGHGGREVPLPAADEPRVGVGERAAVAGDRQPAGRRRQGGDLGRQGADRQPAGVVERRGSREVEVLDLDAGPRGQLHRLRLRPVVDPRHVGDERLAAQRGEATGSPRAAACPA